MVPAQSGIHLVIVIVQIKTRLIYQAASAAGIRGYLVSLAILR